MPEIDQGTLSKKLSLVGKSTKLGWHQEPRFKQEGQSIVFSRLADVKDQWGMAYGVLFTAPRLRNDGCGDEIGCGGFDGARVALITVPDGLRALTSVEKDRAK